MQSKCTENPYPFNQFNFFGRLDQSIQVELIFSNVLLVDNSVRRRPHIMDGLSGAASVIAVIDISANIAPLSYQYSVAVKDAKDDIEHVRRKVSDITHILEKIKQLLDSQDKTRLSTTQGLFSSPKQCLKERKSLEAKLDPGKTRKTISRFGLRALMWPFSSKQVDKVLLNLEGYEKTFSLAQQVRSDVSFCTHTCRMQTQLLTDCTGSLCSA
jgi:hypothetical protein